MSTNEEKFRLLIEANTKGFGQLSAQFKSIDTHLSKLNASVTKIADALAGFGKGAKSLDLVAEAAKKATTETKKLGEESVQAAKKSEAAATAAAAKWKNIHQTPAGKWRGVRVATGKSGPVGKRDIADFLEQQEIAFQSTLGEIAAESSGVEPFYQSNLTPAQRWRVERRENRRAQHHAKGRIKAGFAPSAGTAFMRSKAGKAEATRKREERSRRLALGIGPEEGITQRLAEDAERFKEPGRRGPSISTQAHAMRKERRREARFALRDRDAALKARTFVMSREGDADFVGPMSGPRRARDADTAFGGGGWGGVAEGLDRSGFGGPKMYGRGRSNAFGQRGSAAALRSMGVPIWPGDIAVANKFFGSRKVSLSRLRRIKSAGHMGGLRSARGLATSAGLLGARAGAWLTAGTMASTVALGAGAAVVGGAVLAYGMGKRRWKASQDGIQDALGLRAISQDLASKNGFSFIGRDRMNKSAVRKVLAIDVRQLSSKYGIEPAQVAQMMEQYADASNTDLVSGIKRDPGFDQAIATQRALGIGTTTSGQFAGAAKYGGFGADALGGSAGDRIARSNRAAKAMGLGAARAREYTERQGGQYENFLRTGIGFNQQAMQGTMAGMTAMGMNPVQAMENTFGMVQAGRRLSDQGGPRSGRDWLMMKELGGLKTNAAGGASMGAVNLSLMNLEEGNFQKGGLARMAARAMKMTGGDILGAGGEIKHTFGKAGAKISMKQAFEIANSVQSGPGALEETIAAARKGVSDKAGAFSFKDILSDASAGAGTDPKLQMLMELRMKEVQLVEKLNKEGEGLLDVLIETKKVNLELVRQGARFAGTMKDAVSALRSFEWALSHATGSFN